MAFYRLNISKCSSFIPRQRFVYNNGKRICALSTLAASKQLKSIDDIPRHPRYLGLGMAIRLAKSKLLSGKPLGKAILDYHFEDAKQFGKIFITEVPGLKLVTLVDPEDVEKVFRNESKLPRRLDIPVMDYYREKRKAVPGVAFANGEDWYRYRKTVSKRILKPREVAEHVSVFNDIVGDFIAHIHSIRSPAGTDTEYEVEGLDNELFKWSFESVAHVLFDRRFGSVGGVMNPEAHEFIKSVGGFLETMVSAMMIPMSVLKIYRPKSLTQFFGFFDNIYKYTELFITERLQELEKAGKLDPKLIEKQNQHPERVGFIEFLLTKENLSQDDLMASIVDILFGGVDTTSNAMQWFLYMMSKNQDKQEKLYQEICQVLGDGGLPDTKTLAKMPYLKACFKETLRLFPLVSAINRVIPEDMEIQGYHLPEGTGVQFNIHYMSRSEDNFEQAEKFEPERWLRNENKALVDINPFSSLAFGFGTRMCAGRRIAELELYLLASRLIQKYQLKYPENELVEPFMRGVTIPDRPVRVKFIKRV